MKRMHVHLTVGDLAQSTGFYSALFGAEPSVVKPDYVKWMLDDPRVNFAISTRARTPGLDHLGIQVDSMDELDELGGRLARAEVSLKEQRQATCCYAKSEKTWTVDPQGVAWETFFTHGEATVYGEDRGAAAEIAKRPTAACCAPTA
jgi:catechol 2,3-dioxygenase-like lactoylglutathione lyase family enzyme